MEKVTDEEYTKSLQNVVNYLEQNMSAYFDPSLTMGVGEKNAMMFMLLKQLIGSYII